MTGTSLDFVFTILAPFAALIGSAAGVAYTLRFGLKRAEEKNVEQDATIKDLTQRVRDLEMKTALLENNQSGMLEIINHKVEQMSKQISEIFDRINK